MEQEHGTDAAAICKGVLLRVGMAAAMSTAVLGFLSYHVLPRLRKTDYLRMVSDADAQTALTLAPLVLLAICCLCVYPLIGHGKRSRAAAASVAGAASAAAGSATAGPTARATPNAIATNRFRPSVPAPMRMMFLISCPSPMGAAACRARPLPNRRGVRRILVVVATPEV